MIDVRSADPRDPQITALLQASHTLMQSLFPPEDNFFLSIDDLCTPDILFFAAFGGDTPLGTGALALKDGYGEVKSMFTAGPARGKGVADAVLSRLIDTARAHDLPLIRLETGNLLTAAHRLYARHGFTVRGPFGDYPDAKTSIFMEKALAPSSG